ncbi:MAG TPA: hypothetical protein VLT35_05165, partial [Methanocella sp.]|nr:hypothetical protein [Methanocella sp.]
GGKVDKLICTYSDITERKRVERELAEAKSRLERYLDLIKHDMSNMHQVTLAQLEMARETFRERGRLEDDDIEMIQTAIDSLERSDQLIDDMDKQQIKEGATRRESLNLNKPRGGGTTNGK